MGEEAEDVLSSINISEDDKTKYSKVLEKLNSFFKIRKNVILERAKFNCRYQLPGESAEQYIATLYHLVENCQYGELAQEMIRDRLVVGISDKALSEQLCVDGELTLEKAKTMIRQREAVHEQRNMLQSSGSSNHTLQLLTKLSQRTVDLQVTVPVQLHPNQQVLHNLQNRGANGVKVSPTLEISAQLNKLNAIKAKRKDNLVVSVLLPMSGKPMSEKSHHLEK